MALRSTDARERGQEGKNLDLIDLSGSGEAGLRLWPRTDPDSRVNQNGDWVQRSFPGGISRMSVFVHGKQKASCPLFIFIRKNSLAIDPLSIRCVPHSWTRA